jgi:anthranilate synthase/aminodeoxychorismate synthase-like glutamine amidotransferase
MILLLDNYDSFVYNLARYVEELGYESMVRRSDTLTVDDVAAMRPTHIILSPGPCTPHEAGICTQVVRQLGAATPILGVCLGHQCIGEAYGGITVRAVHPLHGKTAPVLHSGCGVLRGIPTPFLATRYHSLVIDPSTCPAELQVTARSEEGEIMAVQHISHPVSGVQFHPESVATEWGHAILANFLGQWGNLRGPDHE